MRWRPLVLIVVVAQGGHPACFEDALQDTQSRVPGPEAQEGHEGLPELCEISAEGEPGLVIGDTQALC